MGGNAPLAKDRPSSETCKSSVCCCAWYCNTRARQHGVRTPETAFRLPYLRHDQVLAEFGKPNNVVEQLRLPPEELRAANQLQRVLQPEEALVAPRVLVHLADDLVRVDEQLRVARPGTVPHVLLDERPLASVVTGVVRFDVAVLAEASAIPASAPNKVVRVRRVEVQDLQPEVVGRQRHVHAQPCSARVGCVVEIIACSDEVGAVMAIRVVIESDEAFSRLDLMPGIALVAGLPDSVVIQANEDSLLRVSESTAREHVSYPPSTP